ncbi:fucose 4-O-acetylase-like acetyltransferase [Pedobacter cryoconitis]|uniref:acyltransferase family protein n=1 Tax=Pedobacter cryoconitis TaxID=188932 RepID=UPI0016099F6B|nr:acyltransferase family protein [Pedobacter cryoconitis]MBB6271531.1 fucose 4-O-acetylase-like acetyltransferase [Pedobacter cryoconitis]
MVFNDTQQVPSLKQGRDKNIDALRGFAIILVILGHSLQYSGLKFDENICFRLIYSFHMPLFMFISGYVSLFSVEKIVSGFKKRSVLLLFPFFSWAAVNFIVKSINQSSFSWLEAKTFFFHLIQFPDDNGLWFLWVLFMINAILVLLKLCKIPLVTGLLIVWVILNLIFVKWSNINFLGLSLLKYFLFYFLLGILCFRNKERFSNAYRYILYSCCLLFPIFVFFWYRTQPPSFIVSLKLDFLKTKVLWLIYQYVCGILGIGMAIVFIEILDKLVTTITDFFRKVGLITLEIYASHFYFLSIGSSAIALYGYFYKIILMFFFALFGSMVLIYFMKKSNIISLVFFGQVKKRISNESK